MLYDEQIAALRRLFRMSEKGAVLLNYLRVAETPVLRLDAAVILYPGKSPSNVDNLMSVYVRPHLQREGITIYTEPGRGWYLLSADKAKLTTMMESPHEGDPAPLLTEGSDRHLRLTIYIRKDDLEYYNACAGTRNESTSSLTRRLMSTIARDKMLGAILDDGVNG